MEATVPDETNGHAAQTYRAGDPYPLGKVRGQVFSVLQRDNRLIANKSGGGVRFVVPAEKLADPLKQTALRQLQQQLANVYARGHRISKITVTGEGHVVYVFDNQAYFAGHAPEGAEGFVFEERSQLKP